MAQPHRALRADAARNRGRILEVAYETFAAEGVAAPIDEIARRAGVGAGTVYRNFPTKEALFTAVFEDRIATMLERARALLATDPTDALFVFLREMIEVHGVKLRRLPDEVLEALYAGSQQAMAKLVADDPVAAKVQQSFAAFLRDVRAYHEISEQGYINARRQVMGELISP